MEFAISPHIPSILEAVKAHEVVLVSASTGSGKSLALAPELSAGKSRVFITVPTVAAAKLLYDRQKVRLSKDERYKALQAKAVGVSYRGAPPGSADKESKIVYWTAGSFYNAMLERLSKLIEPSTAEKLKGMAICHYLIIDEIHGGSVENYFLMRAWLYMKKLGAKVPKLILSSATPDVTKLRQLFGELLYEHPYIDASKHKIEVRYEDRSLGSHRETYKAALRRCVLYDRELGEGAFLIFMPGRAEIEELARDLLNEPNVGRTFEILPVYGEKRDEVIDKINAPLETGKKRKIIIATNMAESAITINSAILVIDTLREKRNHYSKLDSKILHTTLISKASADQRRGRVGRERNGYCHRLCTREEYEALQPSIREEIDVVPLHNYWLRIISLRIPEIELLPNDSERLSRTKQLCELLKLTKDEGVSEKGKVVSQLDISIRCGSILYDWFTWERSGKAKKEQTDKFADFPAVLATCLIECFDNTYLRDEDAEPVEKKIDAEEEQIFDKSSYDCDLTAWLTLFSKKIWPAYREKLSSGSTLNRPAASRELRNWSKANNGNFNQIKEVFNTAHAIFDILIELFPITEEGVKKPREKIFPRDVRVDETLTALSPFIENAFEDLRLSFVGGLNYRLKGVKRPLRADKYLSVCTPPTTGAIYALFLKDRRIGPDTLPCVGFFFKSRGVPTLNNEVVKEVSAFAPLPKLISLDDALRESYTDKEIFGKGPDNENSYSGWISVA